MRRETMIRTGAQSAYGGHGPTRGSQSAVRRCSWPARRSGDGKRRSGERSAGSEACLSILRSPQPVGKVVHGREVPPLPELAGAQEAAVPKLQQEHLILILKDLV